MSIGVGLHGHTEPLFGESEATDVDVESYDAHDAMAENTDLALPDAELPGGFSFDGGMTIRTESSTSAMLGFSSGDESLRIHTQSETTHRIDYESSDRYEMVDIGETTGYRYTNEDYTVLHFEDGQQYTVSGDLSNGTVIRIAETIIDE